MTMTYDWHFPLYRTHQGMLLGNGQLGAMVWGEGKILKITLGRADCWDRRGGRAWTAEMSYANILKHRAAGDEAGLNQIFAGEHLERNNRPSVLPIGRFELELAAGVLELGQLDLAAGECRVVVRVGRRPQTIRLVLAMDQPVLAVRLPRGLRLRRIRRVTSWDYVGEQLADRGFTPPQSFRQGDTQGWVQPVPEDPAISAAVRTNGQDLLFSVALAAAAAAARQAATAGVQAAAFDQVAAAGTRWWRRYWRQIGRVELPNDRLQFLHDYGMYKFAGLTAFTRQRAVPATLQGPWIEEYQLPPWSSDYHFNINVQMCYWPAYHGNAIENLRPLFEMVHGWTDVLRHNAKMFLGVEDGRLLPHAVSDDCKFICGYWGHSVDHGSTAWVAQMMFRYYRYTLDRDFLREIAWPFMVGTMAVYEGMLERRGDGYHLELGVSPEYFTPQHQGLGPNASFQLACIRRLAEDLLDAAAVLKEKPRQIWKDYLKKIPRACLGGQPGKEMIMLWEGQGLDETHRHHSHLGGIVPFDIFDADREDDYWRGVLGRSLDQWVYKGKGLWSGWCVPWAAMIYTRVNAGRTAEMLLEAWQHVFSNLGHGTLHDADIPGLTGLGQSLTNAPRCVGIDPETQRQKREIMQMDAGMGVTAAIQEMLLHTRRGVNYVMAGVPNHWRTAAFRNFLTDGGFLISAERRDGALAEIVVSSPKGGECRIANPWRGPVRQTGLGRGSRLLKGEVLTIATKPGQRFVLRPAR